ALSPGEVRAAQAADRKSGRGAAQAHAPRAVEEEQVDLTAEAEDAVGLDREETFDAEVPVSQNTHEPGKAQAARGRNVADAGVRFEEGEGSDGERGAHVAALAGVPRHWLSADPIGAGCRVVAQKTGHS